MPAATARRRTIPGPLVLRAVVVNRLPGTGFRPPETDAPKRGLKAMSPRRDRKSETGWWAHQGSNLGPAGYMARADQPPTSLGRTPSLPRSGGPIGFGTP